MGTVFVMIFKDSKHTSQLYRRYVESKEVQWNGLSRACLRYTGKADCMKKVL